MAQAGRAAEAQPRQALQTPPPHTTTATHVAQPRWHALSPPDRRAPTSVQRPRACQTHLGSLDLPSCGRVDHGAHRAAAHRRAAAAAAAAQAAHPAERHGQPGQDGGGARAAQQRLAHARAGAAHHQRPVLLAGGVGQHVAQVELQDGALGVRPVCVPAGATRQPPTCRPREKRPPSGRRRLGLRPRRGAPRQTPTPQRGPRVPPRRSCARRKRRAVGGRRAGGRRASRSPDKGRALGLLRLVAHDDQLRHGADGLEKGKQLVLGARLRCGARRSSGASAASPSGPGCGAPHGACARACRRSQIARRSRGVAAAARRATPPSAARRAQNQTRCVGPAAGTGLLPHDCACAPRRWLSQRASRLAARSHLGDVADEELERVGLAAHGRHLLHLGLGHLAQQQERQRAQGTGGRRRERSCGGARRSAAQEPGPRPTPQRRERKWSDAAARLPRWRPHLGQQQRGGHGRAQPRARRGAEQRGGARHGLGGVRAQPGVGRAC